MPGPFKPGIGMLRPAMRSTITILLLSLAAGLAKAQETDTYWLDELEVKSFSEGIPAVVARRNQRGDTFRIAKKTYDHGIGFAATAVMPMQLSGNGIRFEGLVGLDEASAADCACRFLVLGDKKVLFESNPLHTGLSLIHI